MPRKSSRTAKKTTDEAKGEVVAQAAPRRSGRAVAVKPDPPTKDASRSRRSSTAAQTAASVADSRGSRGRSGSQRESPSPSEPRVKSARRSTSAVNYKESDGEEEANAPKFDENFESGEEFEESDSDEKSKPRARGRSSKTSPRVSKGRAKTASRGRRGRPSKKKGGDDEEENETVELSDDSNDVVAVKKSEEAAPATKSARTSRSRRQTSEVVEIKSPASENKSRRSGRGSTSKNESAKKRPSRSSAQPKKYTEDDDDVEEIADDKVEDGEKDVKDSRKRKRGASPEESSKRLKEESELASDKESAGADEKLDDDIKEKGEPMDVDDESSKSIEEISALEADTKEDEKQDSKKEAVKESVEQEKMDQDDVSVVKDTSPKKEEEKKSEEEKKHEEEKKPEKVEEAVPVTDSGYLSQESLPSVPVTVGPSQESKPIIKETSPQKPSVSEAKVEEHKTDSVTPIKEVIKPKEVHDSPKPLTLLPKPVTPEKKLEKSPEKIQQPLEFLSKPITPEKKLEKSPEKVPQPSEFPSKPITPEKKPEKTPEKIQLPSASAIHKTPDPLIKPVCGETTVESKKPESFSNVSAAFAPAPTPPAAASARESSQNGSEQNNPPPSVAIPTEVISAPVVNEQRPEKSTLKENGAHNDIQNNSVPANEQYYSLPGRKYIVNTKLSESQRQAIKNQVFGFVSYNLGTPNMDLYALKDKLLNEFNKLDAHLICLQQVGKHFYSTILEPSLDALGFKSTFCQPEESLKGMATFYKSSLFRLSTKTDLSLKKLIEKEIDASTTLGANDKNAVKSQIRKCGNVLFTQFSSVVGQHSVTVANVQIPPTDLNTHALQVSCLAQEVLRFNGGTAKPILIGGEFNIAENDASYQLLRDGYLSNDMIEELSRRKDIILPGKENTSLLNLFWNSFQHPSCNLCSCYTSVLGREFFIPELKASSPDLLWYSVGSLHAVGVLDIASDKLGDRHLSLKADIAFSQ